MTAYLIAKINVTNMEQYKEYTKVTPAAIEKYGGKFIVRGGEVTTLEGPQETDRVVVLEFPSAEQAAAFYHSDDYQAAKKLRAGAATGSFIVVNGV